MSVDGILEAIRSDTAARIRELADATAAEVAAISSRAEEEAHQAEIDAAAALDRVTEREVTVIVDRGRLEARRAVTRAVEAAYQDTLDEVRSRLVALRASAGYRGILAGLLDEALRVVSDPSRVIVDTDDLVLAKELLAERGVSCDVASSTSSRGGGLDIETDDGRLVHNSFDIRLVRADERMRAIVAGRLPEGVGG